MSVEQLESFRGTLEMHERDGSGEGDGGKRTTYELVINPTDNSLNRSAQDFMQPNV
jgi:hypothetical protein